MTPQRSEDLGQILIKLLPQLFVVLLRLLSFVLVQLRLRNDLLHDLSLALLFVWLLSILNLAINFLSVISPPLLCQKPIFAFAVAPTHTRSIIVLLSYLVIKLQRLASVRKLDLLISVLEIKHIPAALALLLALESRHHAVFQAHCGVVLADSSIQDSACLVLAVHFWQQRFAPRFLARALGDAGAPEDFGLGICGGIFELLRAREVLELEGVEGLANRSECGGFLCVVGGGFVVVLLFFLRFLRARDALIAERGFEALEL